jgi:hypothetical protein
MQHHTLGSEQFISSATLKTHASPVFGALPVQDIDTALVLKIIEPLWPTETETETASRVRNRIELVLDWAKSREYRSGENPARWRGQLYKVLPKRSQVQPTRNFPALPYAQIPLFMAKLREHTGTAARELEFVVLTATRVNESTMATWSEIDPLPRSGRCRPSG